MSLKYDYIEPNPSRLYKDINMAMTRHPITNELSVKGDDAAIKQSLRNLILLGKGEKPFHPEIGGGVYDLLFENFNMPGMEDTLRYRIAGIIHKYEPRVDLTRIDFDPNYDSNSLSINIYYVVLNTLMPSNIEIFLKITR